MRPSGSSAVGVPRMTHRRVRKDREEAIGWPTEAMNHFCPNPPEVQHLQYLQHLYHLQSRPGMPEPRTPSGPASPITAGTHLPDATSPSPGSDGPVTREAGGGQGVRALC